MICFPSTICSLSDAPAPRPPSPWKFLLLLLAAALLGCAPAVVTSVGPDAPIWLSSDIDVVNPFVWIDGKKVQMQGRVHRRMGDLIVTPPTTQSAGK